MRTGWKGFPDIIRNADLGTLKADDRYTAAKSGDWKAAIEMVADHVTGDYLRSIRNLIGIRTPVVLPVMAEESTGRNKIPAAAATVICSTLHLEVCTDIVQAEYVGRTGKGIDHRFAFQPTFTGRVVPGQEYFLVDDTLSVGGTIAQLKGYIESHGGKVVGASALTAHKGCLSLPVTEKMLNAIKLKHGDSMTNFVQEEFGYDITALTQQEAGHFRTAASADALRDRITAARNAAGHGNDEPAPEDERAAKAPGSDRGLSFG
jgi:hypothetical protein